jgi:hypothetical protein
MKKEKGRETGTAAVRRNLVPEITAEIGIRLTLDPEGVICLEIERRSGGERVGEVVEFPVDRVEIVEFPTEPEEIEKFRREHVEAFELIRAATNLEAVFDRNFPNLIAELFGALYWRAQHLGGDPTEPLDKESKKKAEKELVAKMRRLETTFKEIMIPPRWKQHGDSKTDGFMTIVNYHPVRMGRDPDSSEEMEREKERMIKDVGNALQWLDGKKAWSKTLKNVADRILEMRREEKENPERWLINELRKFGLKWKELKAKKL